MNETKLRKFKLIDVDGYYESHPFNREIALNFIKDNIFKGYLDETGDLINMDIGNETLISEREFQFFEQVFEEEESTFPQIGDHIKFSGSNKHYEVVGVHGSKCMILSEKGDYLLADITEVVQYTPLTEDEIITRGKVKQLIQRYTLDTALDHLMEEFTIVKKGEGK